MSPARRQITANILRIPRWRLASQKRAVDNFACDDACHPQGCKFFLPLGDRFGDVRISPLSPPGPTLPARTCRTSGLLGCARRSRATPSMLVRRYEDLATHPFKVATWGPAGTILKARAPAIPLDTTRAGLRLKSYSAGGLGPSAARRRSAAAKRSRSPRRGTPKSLAMASSRSLELMAAS